MLDEQAPPASVLDEIRRHAVASAPPTWPELAAVIEHQLADPFPPLDWLPLAIACAAGAPIECAVPFCVAWALGRVADRCANIRPASPRTTNHAAALRQIATLVLHAMPSELGGHELASEQAAVAVQRAAGYDRSLAGEVRDLDDYLRIVQDRTCTTYVFAGFGGARAAQAEPPVVQACREAGYHLAIAVQMRRDIASARSPAGDLTLGRRTFPIWYGLGNHAHAANRELRALVFHPSAAIYANRIKLLLDELDAFRDVLGEAEREHQRALAAIARCPGDPALAIACMTRLLDGVELATPRPEPRRVPKLQLP
jgi:hypothetical protein